MFKHIKPGSGNLALLDQFDQRIFVNDLTARRVHEIRGRLHQSDAAGRKQVKGCRRRRAIDRDNIHASQHLIEAVPVGRFQLFLNLCADALAVVIMDRQTESLGAAGNGCADAAHTDNTQTLAPDTAPQASKSATSPAIRRHAH